MSCYTFEASLSQDKFRFKQRNTAGYDYQGAEHIKGQNDGRQQSHQGLEHQL